LPSRTPTSAAGRRPSARPRHGACRPADRQRRHLHRPGQAAIAENANEDVKVLVVGNPCNTNAYIAAAAAKFGGRTNPNNYHGMLRLDHNRALSQLAAKIWPSKVSSLQEAGRVGQPLPHDVRRLPLL
jgi:hypothetical protein